MYGSLLAASQFDSAVRQVAGSIFDFSWSQEKQIELLLSPTPIPLLVVRCSSPHWIVAGLGLGSGRDRKFQVEEDKRGLRTRRKHHLREVGAYAAGFKW